MSTSAINTKQRKKNRRIAVAYLAVCAFCGFFSSVYFRFSHGVSSDYMVFLCLYPFVGGVVPYTALYLTKLPTPKGIAAHCYNWGVATIAIGSMIRGIIDISGYVVTHVTLLGTEVNYTKLYFVAGGLLMAYGIVLYVIGLVMGAKQKTVAN